MCVVSVWKGGAKVLPNRKFTRLRLCKIVMLFIPDIPVVYSVRLLVIGEQGWLEGMS